MKKMKFLTVALSLILLFAGNVKAQFFLEIPDSIAVGDSASAGVDMNGKKLIGIVAPDTLEQDTLTFWTSANGTTWKKVYTDKGSGIIEVKVGIKAGSFNGLYDANQWYFLERYLKIQYGPTGADVDATGAKDHFKIVTGGYQ